jgi:hypothetical protein
VNDKRCDDLDGGRHERRDVAVIGTRGLIILALILAASPHVGAAPADDPRAYCARHESYRTQLYCIEEETAARERLARRGGAIAPEIWAYCSRHDSRRTVEYCITGEEEAKRKLGR